jgi:hypothetical protein
LEDAESHFGLSISDSLAELVIDNRKDHSTKTRKPANIESDTYNETASQCELSQAEPESGLPEPKTPQPADIAQSLPTLESVLKLASHLGNTDLEELSNKIFQKLTFSHNLTSNPANFCSLSIKAMQLLKKNNKNNLMYKFALALCKTKPGTDEPVFPMDRMPFGLVEYQIEFFSCTHIKQVSICCVGVMYSGEYDACVMLL